MKKRLALLLATWFGSGLIPPVILKGMAGTYGSFFSIPLCVSAVFVSRLAPGSTGWENFLYSIIAINVMLVGLWAIPIAEQALGPRTDWHGRTKIHDQNQIVIDETFGMLVACWPLVYLSDDFRVWQYVLAFGLAFGLFRLFDVTKPPGVRYFDRQESAWGVMMDDGIAGVYAGLCLIGFLLIFR